MTDLQRMPPEQASAAVTARLGRPPTDAVEAAIVLEAWRGLGPDAALQLGSDAAEVTATALAPYRPSRSSSRLPSPVMAQAVALLAMLGAVSLWATPMISWIGKTGFSIAWRVALPIVLGLQWVVQARFVEQQRLAQLRAHLTAARGLSILALVAVAWMPPSAALVTIGLVVPWAGMVILGERRALAGAYVSVVVLGSVMLRAGLPPRAVLFGLTAFTAVVIESTLRRAPAPDQRPNPLRPSLLAGLVGVGIGGIIVVGAPGRPISEGGTAALLMIPSVVGSLWGASRLRALWYAIPLSMRTVELLGPERVPRYPALSVFAGAMGRYLLATAALSALLLGVAPGQQIGWSALALGYAVLGLAGLLAALSWSYGHHMLTLVGVLTGFVVVVVARLGTDGAGALAVGALPTCIVLSWPVAQALVGVERSFVTRLQIP